MRLAPLGLPSMASEASTKDSIPFVFEQRMSAGAFNNTKPDKETRKPRGVYSDDVLKLFFVASIQI